MGWRSRRPGWRLAVRFLSHASFRFTVRAKSTQSACYDGINRLTSVLGTEPVRELPSLRRARQKGSQEGARAQRREFPIDLAVIILRLLFH